MEPEIRHLSIMSGAMHTEQWNGREHLVVPVVALTSSVIHAVNAPNPEFVPLSSLSKSPEHWNGHPIMLGHPVRGGKQCSAHDAEILKSHSFGFVRGAYVNGSKLGMEAVIDPDRLNELGQQKLLERIRSGDPIEVSVGAFVTTNNKEGLFGDKKYKGEWTSIVPDHLAFLPNTTGACSIAAGCGTHRAAEELVVAGGPGSGPRKGGGKGGSVKGTKYTEAELTDAARKAGVSIFGKEATPDQVSQGERSGLVFDPPDRFDHADFKELPPADGNSLDFEPEEEPENNAAYATVDDYEYQFFPSSGKGADVSNEWVSKLKPDVDGNIYLYDATSSGVRVIHNVPTKRDASTIHSVDDAIVFHSEPHSPTTWPRENTGKWTKGHETLRKMWESELVNRIRREIGVEPEPEQELVVMGGRGSGPRKGSGTDEKKDEEKEHIGAKKAQKKFARIFGKTIGKMFKISVEKATRNHAGSDSDVVHDAKTGKVVPDFWKKIHAIPMTAESICTCEDCVRAAGGPGSGPRKGGGSSGSGGSLNSLGKIYREGGDYPAAVTKVLGKPAVDKITSNTIAKASREGMTHGQLRSRMHAAEAVAGRLAVEGKHSGSMSVMLIAHTYRDMAKNLASGVHKRAAEDVSTLEQEIDLDLEMFEQMIDEELEKENRAAGGPGSGPRPVGPGGKIYHNPEKMKNIEGTEPGTKDVYRIKDIIKKSKGSRDKQLALTYQMAEAITKPDKAMRRGNAAQDEGHPHIAKIFFDRNHELMSRAAEAEMELVAAGGPGSGPQKGGGSHSGGEIEMGSGIGGGDSNEEKTQHGVFKPNDRVKLDTPGFGGSHGRTGEIRAFVKQKGKMKATVTLDKPAGAPKRMQDGGQMILDLDALRHAGEKEMETEQAEPRSLKDRLLSLFHFKAAAASHTDLKDALEDALEDVVPNFLCVDSVYLDDTVVYMVGSSMAPVNGPDDITMYRRSFTADEDGNVDLLDDAVEVEAVTTYEPVDLEEHEDEDDVVRAAGGPGSGPRPGGGKGGGGSAKEMQDAASRGDMNEAMKKANELNKGGGGGGGKGAATKSGIESAMGRKFSPEASRTIGNKTEHIAHIEKKNFGATKASLLAHGFKSEGKIRGEETFSHADSGILGAALKSQGKNGGYIKLYLKTAEGSPEGFLEELAQFAESICTCESCRALAPKMTDCPTCDGSGEADGNPCETCDGEGEIPIKTAEEGCGCGNSADMLRAAAAAEGDSNMTTEARAAVIKALTENPASGYDTTDAKWLENVPCARLEIMQAAVLKAAEDKKTEELRTAAKCKTCNDIGKAFGKPCPDCAQEPKTAEEWLQSAPEEIRSLVARQKASDAKQKADLVGALKTAQDAYSEADLTAMPVNELTKLAKAVKVDAPDFSGRGLPRTAETDVFSNPPNGYALVIAAQKS